MEKFKEVEATRRTYHRDPSLNSVHRSSLMVPEIQNTQVSISFLNHFLLKRNHENVACKITAVGIDGKKIESRLHKIDKPIVYTIPLSEMVDKPVSNYIVEFFSADNLFIPFPAVMINHKGKNFINQVHSFNRVLNDIFEDDTINSQQVMEASIDLSLNKNSDTFLLFTAGPLPCNHPFEIEIITKEKVYRKTCELKVPRFGLQKISVRENFSIPEGAEGMIKVKQPHQLLFFGRMLCGQTLTDGSFSANHSYYDSSTAEEYWDDTRPSQRIYPFFNELKNRVRFYPIMSPSSLQTSISLFSNDGVLLGEFVTGNISSPSNEFLDIDVNSIVIKNNLDLKTVSSFSLTTKVLSGKMPTRIGHQLIFGAGGLHSSIAVSLFNPNMFIPKDKNSFKWGQLITGGGYDSFVGIVADANENTQIDQHNFIVKFYSEKGLFAERDWNLKNGAAKKFAASMELKSELNSDDTEPRYLWCTIEAEHYGLNFFSVGYNLISKHTSGDHGF